MIQTVHQCSRNWRGLNNFISRVSSLPASQHSSTDTRVRGVHPAPMLAAAVGNHRDQTMPQHPLLITGWSFSSWTTPAQNLHELNEAMSSESLQYTTNRVQRYRRTAPPCYRWMPESQRVTAANQFSENYVEPSDCRKITWKKSIQKLWSLVSNFHSAQERTRCSSTTSEFFLALSKQGAERGTVQNLPYLVWSTPRTAAVPQRTNRSHEKQTKTHPSSPTGPAYCKVCWSLSSLVDGW